MMMTRKQYTKEFKLDAVRLVTEQGYTRAEAARNLGLNANMLGRWVQELQVDEAGAFRGNGKLTVEQQGPARRLRFAQSMCPISGQARSCGIGSMRQQGPSPARYP
jgi:transposase